MMMMLGLDSELSLEGKFDLNNPDESARFGRRNRKRGMLGWFKLKVFLLYNRLWISKTVAICGISD